MVNPGGDFDLVGGGLVFELRDIDDKRYEKSIEFKLVANKEFNNVVTEASSAGDIIKRCLDDVWVQKEVKGPISNGSRDEGREVDIEQDYANHLVLMAGAASVLSSNKRAEVDTFLRQRVGQLQEKDDLHDVPFCIARGGKDLRARRAVERAECEGNVEWIERQRREAGYHKAIASTAIPSCKVDGVKIIDDVARGGGWGCPRGWHGRKKMVCCRREGVLRSERTTKVWRWRIGGRGMDPVWSGRCVVR